MSPAKLPFSQPPRKPGNGPPRPASPAGQDVTDEFVSSGEGGLSPTRPPSPALPPCETGPAAGAASPAVAPAPAGAMSVAALLMRIKNALNQAFPQRVNVVGEISNLKLHSSGHIYFRLKDASAAIDAAMFRSAAARLKFKPTDGMEVVAEGRVDVYDARGQLQFYVERLTPKGAGALEVAFRQLCQKLQAEGLFDAAHKVPIKRFPRAIGLVTSPTGAAIRDIRRTLWRRWPATRVYLVAALVQGDGAAASVASAIRLLDANAAKFGIDTIIVARGGGSLEDLWAFNEETVARAIFACQTPIISGVGHEVDVTIADMVADVRAATPTAAAEIAVPDRLEIDKQVAVLLGRLGRRTLEHLGHARHHLESAMRSVVFRDPCWRLRNAAQRMDELSHRLRSAMREAINCDRRNLDPLDRRLAAQHPSRLHERAVNRLDRVVSALAWSLGGRSKRAGDDLAAISAKLHAANSRNRLQMARQKVDMLAGHLEALSYRSILARGFSVTRLADGQIIRSVTQAPPGQRLQSEVADGKIASVVEGQGAPASRPAPGPAEPARAKSSRKPPPDDLPSLF